MSKAHWFLHEVKKELPEDYDPWGQNERWADPEKGYGDCSGGCRWFLPLEGRLGMDWGVCVNPRSHRCGLLGFEHQGCDQFEVIEVGGEDWIDEDPGDLLEMTLATPQHEAVQPLAERAAEQAERQEEELAAFHIEEDDGA